jgi:N-glycosidase YbiA
MATADQIELAFRAGFSSGVGRADWERLGTGGDGGWPHEGAALDKFRAANAERHVLDTSELVCFYEQDFYPLSNFSAFSIKWKRFRFDTLEHVYHWEKFGGFGRENFVQEIVRLSASAHEAFRYAMNMKPSRRPDWDDVKVDIMRQLIRAKADQHEYVRRKLLATGDRELVENSWRDDFWGWGPNRDGQNMLGKLWMELRAELRAGAQ